MNSTQVARREAPEQRLEVRHLRRRLVLLDGLALVIAWMPAQLWKAASGMGPLKWVVTEAVLLVSGLLLFRWQGLYLARVASSRSEEIRRIVRVSVVLGVVHTLLLHGMSVELPVRWLVAGPVILVVLLLWFRGGYRAWLSASRANGRYLRDVVVVGTNADASELVAMLREHPEAGFKVVGVVGDRRQAGLHQLGSLHAGEVDELFEALDRMGVHGVIFVVGAIASARMVPLINQLEEAGVHVQVSNGLLGMSHRRLRATPVAFQSLYYVEPADTSSPQLVAKRAMDVGLAVFTLLVASPVMLLIALAVKLTDGGPVLFGQTRVGRDGAEFRVWKFRSMVVDAEARLAELRDRAGNERNGPLFKLERLQMRPGITGLWQVEARDNPHFGAYRRLDLFYIDNWSINLDLVILVATVEQVLSKSVRSLLRRGPKPVDAPVLRLARSASDRPAAALADDLPADDRVTRPA
jgi:lipopolysaccharide/colanic/teichoic acid biosynthesis glycosyltransferase